MTTKEKKTTASDQYNERMTGIRQQIQRIEVGLRKHQESQKKHPQNWGYTGDLAHYFDELKDVADSLS